MERTVVLVQKSTWQKKGWREKFIVTHETVCFGEEMNTDEVLRELGALGLRPAHEWELVQVLEDMGKKGTRPASAMVALGSVWTGPVYGVKGPSVSCSVPESPPVTCGIVLWSWAISTRWPKHFVFLAVSHRTEFLDDELESVFA